MGSFEKNNHENTKERKHEIRLLISCFYIFVLSWLRIKILYNSIQEKK
jgi:hypothetical protein